MCTGSYIQKNMHVCKHGTDRHNTVQKITLLCHKKAVTKDQFTTKMVVKSTALNAATKSKINAT